jgi:hypothetical protein
VHEKFGDPFEVQETALVAALDVKFGPVHGPWPDEAWKGW